MSSPFLAIPPSQYIAANELAFALFDSFPVSPGHSLVITRRVVPTWFDASPDEQHAILQLINTVQKILHKTLQPTPDGYNVGFNCGAASGQTIPHLHVHIIPRYHGDVPDPRGGVRHVIPHLANYLAPPSPTVPHPAPPILSTGGPDSRLWDLLTHRLQAATHIDVLSSFVQRSGLDVIAEQILAAVDRKACIRILVSDYLGISDPRALRLLLAWQQLTPEDAPGALQVRLLHTAQLPSGITSFHPKAWYIQEPADVSLIVGSSNLSRPALESGIEWNLLTSAQTAPEAAARFGREFSKLWHLSQPLSDSLIHDYEAWVREHATVASLFAEDPVSSTLIEPRKWQAKALASLTALRQLGYQRALVAVATGMGKTMLAALDALQLGQQLGRRPSILVVAHRAQILAQAEAALTAVLDPVFGPADTTWYLADRSELHGALVIASVQKLARPAGLELLESHHFDYAIIDEVHHAHAPTWRRMLARLHAGFTLGLTATPERSDGIDVASLFDDNLACHASIGDGIEEEALVPFHYVGIRDTVNFQNIPWRNGRFDPTQLEREVSQSPRMERLWQAMQQHPADRTIVFCVSQRHALYTRDWLRRRGLTAAAVFSGSGSDSLSESLAALRSARLQCLCAVDLFNEGLDLPAVDRIIMLRPTESRVLFLQQLGRGLRASPGKTRLLVLDFVGNHRVFAHRLLHLLALGPETGTWQQLRQVLSGQPPQLPPGCLLDLDLQVQDVLRELLPTGAAAAVDAYRRLRDEQQQRPTAAEIVRQGYRPRVLAASSGSWFEFVGSEGDLTETQSDCLRQFADWFRMLETTSLNRSYKMVVLQVLLDRGALMGGLEIGPLSLACRHFLLQHQALRSDLTGPGTAIDAQTASDDAFVAWWTRWPISRWLDQQDGRRWFRQDGDTFRLAFTIPPQQVEDFEALTQELVDWRLTDYGRRRQTDTLATDQAIQQSFTGTVSHANGRPILFLPTLKQQPDRPVGPTVVQLPNGQRWVFKLVQVACNVASPEGSTRNQLGELLRGWFGPDAGLPGTAFQVHFVHRDGQWSAQPVQQQTALPATVQAKPAEMPPWPAGFRRTIAAARRYQDYLPVRDLSASAGFWSGEQQPEEQGWVRVSGVTLKPGMFVGRVTGRSMEPRIPDGSWCVFRPCPAGSREGRLLLVQLRTAESDELGGRFTIKRYHSQQEVTPEGWQHQQIQLQAINPDYAPITLRPEDSGDLRILGEFVRVLC